jgi:hypothetical protein
MSNLTSTIPPAKRKQARDLIRKIVLANEDIKLAIHAEVGAKQPANKNALAAAKQAALKNAIRRNPAFGSFILEELKNL